MLQFRLFGIQIELHPSFFILLTLVVLSGEPVFAAASAVFSFLHEFAHRAVAARLGYTAERISFGLFGGVLHIREGFIKPRHELLIQLAGPFFNLLMAFLLYEAYFYFYLPWLVPVILANAVLALYNLMPFYPLDGGKVMDLYLSFFIGYGRAQKISRIFSLIFTVFLFLFGIYLVQYNVLNLFLSVLAVNLYIAREQGNGFIFYRIARGVEENDRPDTPRIQMCREDMKASRIMERLKPHDKKVYAVISGKGKYKGQLNEKELLDAIYYCGLYADLGKMLEFKKAEKGNELREPANVGFP
jgi:stage IV sporulation protein FB